MTILRTSPDTLILTFLSERTQATAPAIQAACRMTPGDVRARLVMLESMRLVSGGYDTAVPPRRVYGPTGEGRRKVEQPGSTSL